MSKALNLSLLANNVNSAGELDGGAVNGPVAEATLAATATESIALATANFTIQEVGGKLCFYYGATLIASMDSVGAIISADNVTAYGTP